MKKSRQRKRDFYKESDNMTCGNKTAEMRIIRHEYELEQIRKRLDEQTKLADAITDLTIQMRVTNSLLQSTAQAQKELSVEMKSHNEKMEQRVKCIELLPGQQVLESRRHIFRNITTTVITGLVTMIIAFFIGMSVDYQYEKRKKDDESKARIDAQRYSVHVDASNK